MYIPKNKANTKHTPRLVSIGKPGVVGGGGFGVGGPDTAKTELLKSIIKKLNANNRGILMIKFQIRILGLRIQ